MIERQAIIAWVYTLKPLKQLKKFGNVHYISKRSKFVYIYVDKDQVEDTIAKLERLYFVRKVERSYRPEVRMDFSTVLSEMREQMVENVLAE